MEKDSKCYVCTKDTLKKYICKYHYFEALRKAERYEDALRKIKANGGYADPGEFLSTITEEQCFLIARDALSPKQIKKGQNHEKN